MKRLISAVALAAVAIMAFASIASADVARYQTTSSLVETTHYNGVTYVHHYAITTNPCVDNTFTGVSTADSPVGINETVHGTLDGSNIHIEGAYHDGSGYTWHYDGPLTGGNGHDSLGLTWNTSLTSNTSNFKNHGDYVSSQGGGSDAAHSCIGMPIH
jgi:hypothetical protein